LLLLCLLLVGLLLPAAATTLAGETHWTLAFEPETPKPLVLKDPMGRLSYHWYVVYRVTNSTDRPLPARLDFTLELLLEKKKSTYKDGYSTMAERHLEQKVAERPLHNWAELRAQVLKPKESREGVAIFHVGREAADFDTMTVYVRGLVARRYLGREENVRKMRDRVLLLKYRYVASRWARGKELKYDGEDWMLEVVGVPDRGSGEDDKGQALKKRLEELRKKAEAERKRTPRDLPKPPAKGSAAQSPDGLAKGATTFGQPNPKLLQTLCEKAAKRPYVRAAFAEAIGPEGRRQQTTGIIYVGRGRKFRIERVLNVGRRRALKELRLFDGKILWLHTTAKGFDDTVRRWEVAGTKREWHSLDGRAEVEFVNIVNPVRAWRLFGDDLLYLGKEQLEGEVACVFDVRPRKELDAVLRGPLSGELVGKAAGRRVRFWIGEHSGFQLRMRVYDRNGSVVASFECSDVELNANIDSRLFVFKPPAGVEVTNMNAAIAGSDDTQRPPSP